MARWEYSRASLVTVVGLRVLASVFVCPQAQLSLRMRTLSILSSGLSCSFYVVSHRCAVTVSVIERCAVVST